MNDTWAITTRTWYTFVEWTWDVRMPLNGTTLRAIWEANTWTEYKVVHIYTWTTDGIGSETVTVTHSGTTDTSVTWQVAPRDGFITPSEEQVYIRPGGTWSMTYVYEREQYTLTYDANGWTPVEEKMIT